MKIKFQVFMLAFMLLLACAGEALEPGDKAPSFRVVSGEDKVMTLESLRGKAVILIYETRGTVEKNRAAKEAFKKWCRDLSPDVQAAVISTPVVNCSSAGLFKGMWKKALRDNSAKEGLTIYGDWDGRMRADYGFADGDSNFMLLDKDGTVRYGKSGLISDAELQNMTKLLDQLAGNQEGLK